MCRADPPTHARAMNTNTVNPQDTTTQSGPTQSGPTQSGPTQSGPTQTGRPTQPARVLLRRSYEDRMLGGVAGGLAQYFGVDSMIVRIAFVVLTVFGGAGIPLYLAGLLLIPDEGSDQSIAGSLVESLQSRSR
jgi:phage shock protein PspC (stress-responsive transcriptional regulator)